jgi:hypothetical protein
LHPSDLAGAILEAATSPAAEFGVEVAANVIEAVGLGLNLGGQIVDGVANGLPNCEGIFTGTVETYANVVAKMGVNAFDGALNLGYIDDNGQSESYYDGITLGGGALAGAGFGGEKAETGDKDRDRQRRQGAGERFDGPGNRRLGNRNRCNRDRRPHAGDRRKLDGRRHEF